MQFNNLIREYTYQNQDGHLNTVNWCFLPIGSTQKEYHANLFMADQREQLILRHLNEQLPGLAKKLGITIIPGWACNLRCTHCVVIDKLIKPESPEPAVADVKQMDSFIKGFMKAKDKDFLELTFVGGEPLLYSQYIVDILELIKPDFGNVTTNLAGVLDESKVTMLQKMDHILISLDGNQEQHNKQRKPLYETLNVYADVINNLKILVKMGLRDKISVQAAMAEEEIRNDEAINEFLYVLLKIGIKQEKIAIHTLHSTPRQPDLNDFQIKVSKNHISASPQLVTCCRHRDSALVIDREGQVYTDYYSMTKLGSVNDLPQNIIDAATKDNSNLPVLNDPNCQDCDVLSFCWGGCTNLHNDYLNPSRNCAQGLLQENVRKSITNQKYNKLIGKSK